MTLKIGFLLTGLYVKNHQHTSSVSLVEARYIESLYAKSTLFMITFIPNYFKLFGIYLSKFNHFINKSYFSSSNKVPLNSEALEQMKQSNELLGINSEYVFPKTNGTCSTAGRLIRSFNHLTKLANVPYWGIHSLRHSFASALSKEKSIKVVADIIGHADTHFTENTYVHVDKEQKIDAVNSL